MLVIIPTYNESENLRPDHGLIRAAVPAAHILVADDNSPDGTGAIADELAAADDHLHVLHRKGKEGSERRTSPAFRGLAQGYQVLVEHDADGSHQPEYLPAILDRLRTAGAVKGSRYVKGGSTKGWPVQRELLSRGGNLWTQLMLGLPVKDATGGFVAWRATTLEGMGLDGTEAAGYGFQVEMVSGDLRGLHHRRGADRVRRARAGQLEDERKDRCRGDAADHLVGPRLPAQPASRACSAGRVLRDGPRPCASPVAGAGPRRRLRRDLRARVVGLTWVGVQIGVLWTIAILIGEAVLGAWLMRREGNKAWRALVDAYTTGRMPSSFSWRTPHWFSSAG